MKRKDMDEKSSAGQRRAYALIGFVLLGWMMLAAACEKAEPTPPSRNIFYEVQMVSISSDQPVPMPTRVAGTGFQVAAADEALLAPDLSALWSIQWECNSDRCTFDQCNGSAQANVRDVLDHRWLEIDRRVDWTTNCGKPISWLSQVDRYSGQERYPSGDALFQFWAGSKAHSPERQVTLVDGRKVNVWCTGPTQAEMAEEDGWMSLYDGEVCYDVRTGMLVFMSYVKRWVFTGIFEGKPYERAYFGDAESYQQLLETTNAHLSFVE
jgi:hypothetical protein